MLDLVLVRGTFAAGLSGVLGPQLAADSNAPHHCRTLRTHPFASGCSARRISQPALFNYARVVSIPDGRQRRPASAQTRRVILRLVDFFVGLMNQRSSHVEQHIRFHKRLRPGDMRFRTNELAGIAGKRGSRQT